MLRKDYNDNLKWNTKDLFKDEDDFKKEYELLDKDLEGYKKRMGHILDSASTLKDFLDYDVKMGRRLEQVLIYAQLKNDEDTADTLSQIRYGQVMNLYAKYGEISSYVVPEILKGSKDLIESYIKEVPSLKEYERNLKEIFKFKKYTLSDKEEQLLASLIKNFQAPNDIYSLLSDADMRFGYITDENKKRVELTEKSYHNLITSNNREVRKKAFQKLFGTYSDFKNTYATILMSEVKNNNAMAKIRGYESALSLSLYRNDIPVEIYDNLINGVKENVNALSEFWKIKKKILKLRDLHLYDVNAPIIKINNKKYKIDEAKKILDEALSILGSDYLKVFDKAFDEGWIDFCPNDNKRNGAYCTACYNKHPYVLMNYDESLNAVSTLAHEMGHAMHYYYAISNHKFQDYGYSIFVAEVASQVNQILLSKYLINKSNDNKEKIALIDDLIQDFKAAIYRQTMFAEFEKIIHEEEAKGNILNQESLSDIYYQLNKEYFGDNIVVDELIRYEWERIPHFYMNFYVYQYATAYAAAIKISQDILKGKNGAQQNYLEFLGLGSTKDPIESLKVAGVDMESKEVLEEAFSYFKDLVKELESLVGELNE